MHENRETSSVSPTGDRSGKAPSRPPEVYAGEESDGVAVCAEQHVVQEG